MELPSAVDGASSDWEAGPFLYKNSVCSGGVCLGVWGVFLGEGSGKHGLGGCVHTTATQTRTTKVGFFFFVLSFFAKVGSVLLLFASPPTQA